MKYKIKFNELNTWIKIGVVGGWITFFYFTIAIIIGFITGISEVAI